MKKAFKIATVIGTTLLLGVTTMAAGGVFSPFVDNNTPDFSVVYGDTSTDGPTAGSLGTYFSDLVEADDVPIFIQDDTTSSGVNTVDITGGVMTDELSLGSNVPAEIFDDGDIEFLSDTSIEWDDGDDTKDYDIHEEIRILDGKVGFITLLDDEDLTDNFALTNNEGISYRYVFDETPDFSKLGTADADNIKIKFLGKNLELKKGDDNSITIVTSQEIVVTEGKVVTVGGVELKVDTIFESHVQVNGVLIEDGKSEKVGGVIVEVDTIAYSSNDKPSVALIRVGEDISEEYSTNDAYIGEDEDDPRWVWDIDLDAAKPYIGILYNEKETDSDDDILYPGQAYTYPEGFAALKFDGTTSVDYKDYSLVIDEEELYDSDENELYEGDDKSVIVLEGEEDSIETANKNEETSKLYLYYKYNSNSNLTQIESYYYDEDENRAMEDGLTIPADGTITKVATLKNDDKEVDVYASVQTGFLEVYFDDNGERQIAARYELSGSSDLIKSLGTSDETSESTEVKLLHKGTLKTVGTRDYDIINENGYKIKNPDTNGENDEVLFSVPSDDVEASISVGRPKILETTTTTTTVGNETVTTTTPVITTTTPAYTFPTAKVTQIESVKDRNLIVVGGSCINGVAAQLLGGQSCGTEFTAATGIGPGQAIIKSYTSPYNAGKIAVLVAGYDKADTDRAVIELKKGTYDLTVGKEYTI